MQPIKDLSSVLGADILNTRRNYIIMILVIGPIIHHIHRFKSSDWLKKGHMTWIIFDNVHVWKLIHVLFFTISLTLKEAVTAAEFGTR